MKFEVVTDIRSERTEETLRGETEIETGQTDILREVLAVLESGAKHLDKEMSQGPQISD